MPFFKTEFVSIYDKPYALEFNYTSSLNCKNAMKVECIIRAPGHVKRDTIAVRGLEDANNDFSEEEMFTLADEFLREKMYLSIYFYGLYKENMDRRMYYDKPWASLPANNIARRILLNEPYRQGLGGYHVPWLPQEKEYMDRMQDPRYEQYKPAYSFDWPNEKSIAHRRWVREMMYRKMQREYGLRTEVGKYWGDKMNAELLEQEKKDAEFAKTGLSYMDSWWQREGRAIERSKKGFFERWFGE